MPLKPEFSKKKVKTVFIELKYWIKPSLTQNAQFNLIRLNRGKKSYRSIKDIHRGQTIPKLTKSQKFIIYRLKCIGNKIGQILRDNGCLIFEYFKFCILIQMETPAFQFPQVRPRGYYTQFKQWPISPLSSNQYWQPDDIVRFLINITQGVMDPYRSHIQFTVETNQQIQPVGQLQVDNSAQSFISQSVVSSNQVEVERITEYDSLAAYLTDIGFSEFVCQGRDSQGIGFTNIPNTVNQSCNIPRTGRWNISQVPGSGNIGQQGDYLQGNFSNPLYAATFVGRGPTLTQGLQYVSPPLTYNGQPTSSTNFIWYTAHNSNGNDTSVSNFITQTGRAMTVRAQYMAALGTKDYPDSNYSLLQSSPLIKNQTWTYQTMLSQGFNKNNPYKLDFSTTNSQVSIPGKFATFPLNCGTYGYQKAYCSQYCRGTNQPTISATVPTVQMAQGKILPHKVPLAKRMFRVPLISYICGILIPPQQFMLIPMKALQNLLIQLTLSKFAMFTSGYCDVHQMDSVGMQYMQKRLWLYSNIQWNLHLYTFPDQAVVAQINASLTKSINISCTGYALSSQFQLPNGGAVRNSWPIGAQYDSLCEVICLFLSNQYQTKSYCRKQFRLSNNVTSMQLKVNTQFYPSQPIVGNAGNPQDVDGTGDNWPYYQLLLLSNNYLFNTNLPLPRINSKNFAINGRIYNTDNLNCAYDPQMYNNMSYAWSPNSINLDTAMGMPSFHERRYVGKAAYTFTWQPYGHSKTLLTGITTTGVRNLDVTFNVSPIQQYPSDQTLLIFSRYNCIVSYSQKGVAVYGK